MKEIAESCPEKVFGNYLKSWPLIKVLDIGGDPVKTSFGTTERPPIPPHIHAGCIHNGKADIKCGKAEAQYFPPISAMTGQENKCVTRMGFKKGVTKEDVEKAMAEFGKSDAVYHLMQDYEVANMQVPCIMMQLNEYLETLIFKVIENETWMVRPGFVHAPGPAVTIEIQFAQVSILDKGTTQFHSS